MNNKEIIEKICPSSINERGEIKSLEKQLLEFEYGIKEYYHPFVINQDSNKLDYAEIASKPLFLNISTVQKLKSKHDMDLKFLLNLNEITKNSVFGFDSIQHESSKIFVTKEKNEKNYPIIFIIREDKKAGIYTVNELTSIYDRKNLQNLIDRTLEKGGSVYINPEKQKEFEELGYYVDLRKTEKEREDFFKDSDNDGITDKEEKEKYNTNPLALDSDGDGRTDFQEIKEDFTKANDKNDKKIDFRYKNDEKDKEVNFELER